MKYLRLMYLGLVVMFLACQQSPNSEKDASKEIDQQVNELLSKMTLEEKIGQMNQYSGFMDFTGPQPNEGKSGQ